MVSDTRIRGNSLTAKLVRQQDWSATPLGPLESWPDVLLTAVNTVLAAPIPMQLFWGPELICIYNDAMVPALSDKHPGSFGKSARVVWREAWPMIGPQMEQVLATGEPVSFGNALVPLLQNGVLEDRYWTYSYSAVFDGAGNIAGVLDVAQDTTDVVLAQQAEQERINSELRLGLALEAASLATWFYDPLRNVVGGDAIMARLFGLFVPEAPAEMWTAAIVPEDRERVAQEFAAGVQGHPYDTEYRVSVDGNIRWLRALARLIPNGEGRNRMIGICEDVTVRKRAEENLRETVERLALAQQVGNIATWEWDIVTGDFTWDEAGAWVYGRPPAELNRIEVLQQYIHKEDLPGVMQTIEPVVHGEGEFNAEFRVCWPDGTNHWLIGKGRPIFDEYGKVVRINGVNIDITERRTAEMALRQSEKLAAVGQIASTISHEINNPLESVTNLLYLSKLNTDDPNLLEYLSTAEIELRRISAITNQTLRFHRQRTRPTEISCVDLFSGALLIFQGRIANAGIRVDERRRAERPVICLEGEIRQVMNNLIGNAIDAMRQHSGTLYVRSTEATDWLTGRKGLRLTVADTGTGMSKRTRSQLFQAFYTTKGISGTGLGLWISQEIVQRHHGRMSVRSSDRPGKSGTVFALFLPFETDVEEKPSLPAERVSV